jgi:glycerophosphoryl diester phosphodiesterase
MREYGTPGGTACYGVVMTRPALLQLTLLLATLLGSTAAPAFDLQGHRGARGLAPENTLAAVDAALALGVNTLELDTVVTADGVVVIHHDPTLNPNFTRDAAGRYIDAPGPSVRSLTLAELQRHDVGRLKPGTRYADGQPDQRAADGERIPTLAQLFERVKQRGDSRVRFNIETKLSPLAPALTPEPEAFVRALLEVIDAHSLRARVTLQSFDWRTLRAAQRLAPDIPTACLSSQQSSASNLADARWTAGLSLAEHGSAPKLVKAAGCAVWSPNFADLTADALSEARTLGLKVVVWTVNDPAAIERMLALGVDGIISDRPDRVRTAMAARGLALPPSVATQR